MDSENKVLKDLLLRQLNYTKWQWRWQVISKVLTLAMIVFVVVYSSARVSNPGDASHGGRPIDKAHTAIVTWRGPIGVEGLESPSYFIETLTRAFKNEKSQGVIIVINSPGGLATQSSMLYDAVMKLRAQNPEKKIYAYIEDIGASGAYYMASACDQIHAHRTSIVGSIGTIMRSVGYESLAQSLGIESRVFKSGEYKNILDPMAPVSEFERGFLEDLAKRQHEIFIQDVKVGRGDRLGDDPLLYSGLFWIGDQALQLGLIDGHMTPDTIAEEVFQAPECVDYTAAQHPWLHLLRGISSHVRWGMHALMHGWQG